MKTFFSLLCLLIGSLSPIMNAAPPDQQSDVQEASNENPKYWISSSSGKTHNSSCRYYKKSKGHGSDTPSGNDCKICGGASRG